MKKIIFLSICLSCKLISFSQSIFVDDFSTFNLAKIDGQGGWSSASPSQGSGSGACAGVSCLPVTVVSKTMSFSNFNSCTQAINPVDGTLATGDGPGKSLGTVVNSGSLYVALLVNFSQPSAGTLPAGIKQVVRLMDNSFTIATRIFIKQAATGSFQIGIDKNGSATNFAANTLSYGQDHLLILKYSFNAGSSTNDVASLFVDPDLSQPEPTASVSVTGTGDVSSITRIVFPWNVTNIIPNGYIGAVAASYDWSQTSLPIVGIENIQLLRTQNGKAILKWNVENGDDFKTFVVQQSNNSINFNDVATLTNEGNKNYSQSINLPSEINYVRLVAIDKSGNKKMSATLSIKAENRILKNIFVSPNPTTDNLNITLSSSTNKHITIQVTDIFGKIIIQKNNIINVGETTMPIDVSRLKAGCYFIKIVTANGETQITKFIKK